MTEVKETNSIDYSISHEADDFEIVTDIANASIDGSIVETDSADLQDAFVLIQQEQEAVKEELVKQNALLSQAYEKLKVAQEEHTNKEKEFHDKINELHGKTASLEQEIQQRDLKLSDNDKKDKELAEAREKIDNLTAQVCQADENVKYHEKTIRRLQEVSAEGFVSVQPTMLQDSMLASELSQKAKRIDDLEGSLAELEHGMVRLSEEELKVKSENQELRHLVTALQEQVDQDRVDLRDIRNRYEEELTVLRNELRRLSGRPSGGGPDESLTQILPPLRRLDGDSGTTLTESRVHDDTIHQFVCRHCMTVLSSQAEYDSHATQCSTSRISNID